MNKDEELNMITDSFLRYALKSEAAEHMSCYDLYNGWIRETGIKILYDGNVRWALAFARNFRDGILPYKKNLTAMLNITEK